MKKVLFYLLLFCGTALLTVSCKTKNKVSTSTSQPKSTADAKSQSVDNATLTLADYLRRQPGVQITGSGGNINVQIRGGNLSASGNNSPLFVIDGSQMGTDYNQVASAVDVNDISKIEVLRDVASTNRYGIQGSAGVIVIKTKRQ